MSISLACVAIASVVQPAPVLKSSNPAAALSFRRAEFWDTGAASTLQIANVLGRWEDPQEFRVRTEFTEMENERSSSPEQAETQKRYEMAVRLDMVERVALQQNAPKLPFTNAEMAAAYGLTVEDFNEMEVSKVAANIVFDCLAQSKSGLIPPDVLKARRDALIGADGGVDLGGLRLSLYKARFLVIVSWFLFGKGNIIGILVLLKVVADATGINTFSEIFDWILAHGDITLVVLGSGSLMTYVGRTQEF